MGKKQPDALRMAEELEGDALPGWSSRSAAAEELRLHAENETLRAGYDAARLEISSLQTQLEAVGAGGVGPLVGAAVQQVTAPDGWQLVPAEPTKEMKAAAVKFANGNAVYKNVSAGVLEIEEGIYGEAYEAMLAAAPQPTPAAPFDDAAFEFWWADHMPNSAREEAWVEWCALWPSNPQEDANAS